MGTGILYIITEIEFLITSNGMQSLDNSNVYLQKYSKRYVISTLLGKEFVRNEDLLSIDPKNLDKSAFLTAFW